MNIGLSLFPDASNTDTISMSKITATAPPFKSFGFYRDYGLKNGDQFNVVVI